MKDIFFINFQQRIYIIKTLPVTFTGKKYTKFIFFRLWLSLSLAWRSRLGIDGLGGPIRPWFSCLSRGVPRVSIARRNGTVTSSGVTLRVWRGFFGSAGMLCPLSHLDKSRVDDPHPTGEAYGRAVLRRRGISTYRGLTVGIRSRICRVNWKQPLSKGERERERGHCSLQKTWQSRPKWQQRK